MFSARRRSAAGLSRCEEQQFMVANDPEDHRPRRALGVDPEEPAPERDAAPDEDESRDDGSARAAARAAGPGPAAPTGPVPAVGTDDDDDVDRRPLYRDEVEPAADEAVTPAAPPPVRRSASRPPAEETTILPRTRRSGYAGAHSDFDDDPEDADTYAGDADEDQPRLGRRARTGLLVAIVAAVVIVGLAIGYTVLNIGDRTAAPSATTGSGRPARGGSSSTTPDPALLTDASMLSAAQARQIAGDRTWKVALTQRGLDADSAQPVCLGNGAAAGRPPAQQTVLRLLSSSGKQAPGALHQADVYATPEEAAQAYALVAKALGSCNATGAYLQSGRVVTGLGDQATAVVVHVSQDGKTQLHSVVLDRTGRVVDLIDVAQPEQAVSVDGVAGALAAVTQTQCKGAGGRCAPAPKVVDGPPPVGGDQPGFLAVADLPPVGTGDTTWAGTVPGPPDAGFTGSGCETTDWNRVKARSRTARTYLLQEGSPTFGLDEIVLTTASAGAARDLVDKVKADLDSCAKRKLTAKVSGTTKVAGTGASGAQVAGWTASVAQRTTGSTAGYRVGVVSVGSKVAYTFLNPQKGLDLGTTEWKMVAVRAGQRASQVR